MFKTNPKILWLQEEYVKRCFETRKRWLEDAVRLSESQSNTIVL